MLAVEPVAQLEDAPLAMRERPENLRSVSLRSSTLGRLVRQRRAARR